MQVAREKRAERLAREAIENDDEVKEAEDGADESAEPPTSIWAEEGEEDALGLQDGAFVSTAEHEEDREARLDAIRESEPEPTPQKKRQKV
jgi:hypothetical protein